MRKDGIFIIKIVKKKSRKMAEIKTLNDMNGVGFGISPGFYSDSFMVDSHRFRLEAIKWIKKDIKIAQKQEIGVDSKLIAGCMRWASRFNLTAEDLK